MFTIRHAPRASAAERIDSSKQMSVRIRSMMHDACAYLADD